MGINWCCRHWQLRDLVCTPTDNPGEVMYPSDNSVHTLDLATGKDSVTAELEFEPRCVQATAGLLAAGGVHDSRDARVATGPQRGLFAIRNRNTGETYTRDLGDYINNAVSLFESPTDSGGLKAVVCNNDHSLYFLDIGNDRFAVEETLRLSAPLNHAAVSPDRRTVIACGDTPQVAVAHPQDGGWHVAQTFESGSDLGFSAAFHPSGTMFGVAFQDGTARLYDVRKMGGAPLAEIRTSRPVELNGAFRCLKFSTGPEDLVFLSEQMHRVHVVDLRDFNNHQVLTIPQGFGGEEQEPDEAIEPIIQSYEEVIDNGQQSSPSPPPSIASRNHHRRVYVDNHSFLQMPSSRYLRYGQNDDGISGLAWTEYDGGSIVVGTDTGIGVWKIDGWARRTFPSYTIR